MIVWLVRHAEPQWGQGTALGWSDPPLSEVGERQAEALADELAGRPLAAVHASDLCRAVRTARVVAARHSLDVAVTPDLRELDFGPWEGRRLADLEAEHPADWAAWLADIRRTPPAFGESVADLERRVGRFACALLAGPPAAEVAVVGHHGSLVALHATLTGGDFAEAWSLAFPRGSARRLEVAAAPWPG
jgi:broad specificity phosphatase PhoE